MSFITDVFKGIKMGRVEPKRLRGGDMQQMKARKNLKESILGQEFLKNGDEAVAETETKREIETETAEQETLEEVSGQEVSGQEISGQETSGQEQLEADTAENKAVVPVKTTGSVGNFGKHSEISKEVGSMGERLGHLASTKEEHHYFQ